ncbi:MAG: ACT domain-containing protein [Spirochaetales bacterium]|nr:ACT domain-containing protein [Spirochaetales bacterium]MBQ3729615.1 ACT domain-containing protein [Spirochaetales bacterium]
MGVRQISVFLENKSGQLAHICRIIADAGINMKALNIAETSDYGVVRLITDKPDLTVRVLSDEGLVCRCTDVVAISVPDVPGGLAGVLEVIARKNISIEYMYSMMGNDGKKHAVMVFQTEEPSEVFAKAGLDVLCGKDIGISES